MTEQEAWVLTALVFIILAVLWIVLNWTFDLIEWGWRNRHLTVEPSAEDGGKLTRERES